MRARDARHQKVRVFANVRILICRAQRRVLWNIYVLYPECCGGCDGGWFASVIWWLEFGCKCFLLIWMIWYLVFFLTIFLFRPRQKKYLRLNDRKPASSLTESIFDHRLYINATRSASSVCVYIYILSSSKDASTEQLCAITGHTFKSISTLDESERRARSIYRYIYISISSSSISM